MKIKTVKCPVCHTQQFDGKCAHCATKAKRNPQIHTPIPWAQDGTAVRYLSKKGTMIADVEFFGVEAEANAAFIVKAVNCHEELLTIAKDVSLACERGGDLQLGPKGQNAGLEEHIKQVIAKAEGK